MNKGIVIMRHFLTLLLICVLAGCSAKITLNTYDRRENLVADSLRVLDSKRITDSIKTADSLLLTLYDKSEKSLLKQEKERAEQAAALKAYAATDTAGSDKSVTPVSPAREVVIDENSPQSKVIDRLQAVIDSLDKAMYGKDPYFSKIKDLTFQDKKAYLKYLLKNHLRDTTQVVTFCECFHCQLKTEHEKLLVIMETQEGDTKGVIHLHTKKTQVEMGDIGNLIYTLSSKVPLKIEYGRDEKNIFRKSQ